MTAGPFLLGLLLALPASAATKPACGRPDSAGRVPVMSEVLECQQGARQAFAEARRKKTGRDPSPEEQDRFDDLQRAEMRAYMEAHPKEATIDGGRERVREAQPPSQDAGILQKIGAALGALKGKTGGAAKAAPEAPPQAEAEARRTIAGVKDGATLSEVDLGAVAEKARQDPEGTLRRAVQERKKQFDTNVPDEVKGFYKKPGE